MEFQITFPGGLRVDAEADGMVIPTDQPIQAGGKGSAPAPFSLFLASIGTCAGIYVLSFCQNHGIPTEGIHLTQKMHFDPGSRRFDRIELQIHVPADFPERHLKSLERSADLCAVKKALANPPEITVASVVG